MGLVKAPKLSKAQQKDRKKGGPVRDYHRQLRIILQSLVDVQRENNFPHPLWVDGKGKIVNFKFPVGMLIGDIQGHDVQCGRYGIHSFKCQSACRDCDIATNDTDNPMATCVYITQQRIQDLIDRNDLDGLLKLSHHWVQNAWHWVDFGGDKYGVHGATPPEPLHWLQLGLIQYAIIGFLKRCTDSTKRKIDDFIKLLVVSLKHQSVRDMPPVDFPRGVTSVSNIKAYEHVGIMLLFYLSLHCDGFLRIFENGGKELESGYRSMDVRKAKKFCKLFQSLLCFHETLRKQQLGRTYVRRHLHKECQDMMVLFMEVVDRKDGNAFKFPKNHQFLHIAHYCERFGPPHNYHSGPGEKNANVLAKQQANRTSRNHATFEQQIGKRLSEWVAINTAYRNFVPQDIVAASKEDADILETKFIIGSNEDADGMDETEFLLHEPTKKKKRKKQLQLTDERLKEFVFEEFADFMPNSQIPCFTAHKRKGYIFRAHPSYRSGPSWHDWAVFKWISGEETLYIPGEIQCFVDLREIATGPQVVGVNEKTGKEIVEETPYEPGIYAVINSLVGPTKSKVTNSLLSHGQRELDENDEMKCSVANVEAIHDTTYCFPHFGYDHDVWVYELKHREKWHEYDLI